VDSAWLWPLWLGVLVGAAIDVQTRRIPNMLTFGLMAVGLGLHATVGDGVGFAAAGLGVAFLVHFALWQLGIDAAGDAKLFMAVGAFLGVSTMLEATVWRLLLHIPFALFVLTAQGKWGNFRAATRWSLAKAQGRDLGERPEPTYQPLGVVVALAVGVAYQTSWFDLDRFLP
jgi:prepilin peptidase CpaA